MKALFIVEHNFLEIHVGVRRVILFYTSKLQNEGYEVYYGTPKSGKIIQGIIKKRSVFKANNLNDKEIIWGKSIVNIEKFDVCIFTNPWLCALEVPKITKSVGIIYDIIPNLIASCSLRFSSHMNVYRFATEHDIGFKYFLENTQRIICISNATNKDFKQMYNVEKFDNRIITHIPFDFKNNQKIAEPFESTVLLVNVFDWRKNIKNIETIIKYAAKKINFKIKIIGKERIDKESVNRFFANLAKEGVQTQWYRDANDTVLNQLYQQTSLLLFPSLYEGLGLPILEAQSFGIPVITSNLSSCPEINMNPNLCFEPNDVEGMALALIQVLSNQINIQSGIKLQTSLRSFLDKNISISTLFNLNTGMN